MNFFAFTPILLVFIYVGFMGVALYLAILTANFLKAGTEAFKLYVRNNR